MGNRPVKIKRNTSISGKKYSRKRTAKKVVSIIFALAALLALGFFGAPAVVEMLNNMGEKQQHVISEPPAEPTPTPGETVEPTTNPGDVENDIVEKTNICSMVDVYSLTNETAITQQAAALKEKGVSYAVVTLKNADGLIHYDSKTAIGSQAKHSQQIDVAKVVEIFGQNDITVVAEIYTFKDKTAPNIDRSTAVKYTGTDMNWWDSSKELGGKPWANPASSTMQQYIADLVQEIKTQFGIKNFIFSGVQLPTGYSLDKRDFGVSESALQAQLQGFIDTMENKVAAFGGDAFFAFDMAAVNGGDVAKYIVAPQRLGAANMLLEGTAEDFAAADLAAISEKLKNDYSVEMLIYHNTEGSVDNPIPRGDDYFVQ